MVPGGGACRGPHVALAAETCHGSACAPATRPSTAHGRACGHSGSIYADAVNATPPRSPVEVLAGHFKAPLGRVRQWVHARGSRTSCRGARQPSRKALTTWMIKSGRSPHLT